MGRKGRIICLSLCLFEGWRKVEKVRGRWEKRGGKGEREGGGEKRERGRRGMGRGREKERKRNYKGEWGYLFELTLVEGLDNCGI